MLAWQAQYAPKLASFYGKQSVNTFQSIRSDIQTLDQKTQGGYLTSVSGTYRTLVDLLIGQGRLPEAEPDPKAPYAHPYYWAPFVLIGNWR